jgi:ABC-type molybdate transport system substrate-binding protein
MSSSLPVRRTWTTPCADQSVNAGAARVFATNQLVVVLPPQNPANLEPGGPGKTGVRVLVAVVDTPIGKVTLTALDKMDKQTWFGLQGKGDGEHRLQ